MPAGDRFFENELFCNDNPVFLRVVQKQTLLGIRREFCLIRGTDADVESTILSADIISPSSILSMRKNAKTNVLLV